MYYSENPFNSDGAVNNMARGTSTSGGRGAIVAKKERAAGTVYVMAVVCQLSARCVGTKIAVEPSAKIWEEPSGPVALGRL